MTLPVASIADEALSENVALLNENNVFTTSETFNKDIRRSYQTLAYAASLTIDATAGEIVSIGALTGNITINAPTSPARGQRLELTFLQDGTGGRTVTWNAAFKTAWQPVPSAGAISSVGFEYDGTNWQMVAGQFPVSHAGIASIPGPLVAQSLTVSATGPYVSTAVAGGADYASSVRVSGKGGTGPWYDITHPTWGGAAASDV